MKFLEAKKTIDKLNDNADIQTVLLATSFQSDAIDIYLQAQFALRNFKLVLEHIPFGNFQQFINDNAKTDRRNLAIIYPWDVLPQLDWRLGYHDFKEDLESLLELAKKNCVKISSRVDFGVYLDVPGKPIFQHDSDNQLIQLYIKRQLRLMGINLLENIDFDLANYLQTGQPFNGRTISLLANELSKTYFSGIVELKKILVTDLDNTIWSGIIGEDGPNGIQYDAEGAGYPHYIYQSLLKTYKGKGILLAAVSKNDQDLAELPFLQNKMLLNKRDFVAIIGNYEAKSAQIASLATKLNLGLESFVFVDDNPLEIAEVQKALPEVTSLLFSADKDSYVSLLRVLNSLFPAEAFSEEDANRTELYQAKLNSDLAVQCAGSELGDFLNSLEMQLSIRPVTDSLADRAFQLLNKSNQFNLNGLRITEDAKHKILNDNLVVFTGSLSDKFGRHGEVITAVVDRDCITYLAMSCRVLNRTVEHAFISAIMQHLDINSIKMNYLETERNTPMQKFMKNHSSADKTLELSSLQNDSNFNYQNFNIIIPEND
ncbi:HAD-IIIC family phosphatase [Reinekea sp. G2M2-21]|uniref:HAD-IIIC family phosphatase n=1 Tax=Reinekea sp. G2M2-21 TaxID=2788942 RepID=UPI0018ABA613|nr:HAD-IIIC family phosphatase [Reinekea sp. G2M2-21]